MDRSGDLHFDVDTPRLTFPIDELEVPTVFAPALRLDEEPAELRPVRHPINEPLVEATGPRLTAVGAYRAAGWRDAPHQVVVRSTVRDFLNVAAVGLPDRFGLVVLDGWRPFNLQSALYAAAYCDPDLPIGFVAPPDPGIATPPSHTTGGAVDVTLTYNGIPLRLGCGFDDFSPAAHTDAFEDTPGPIRDLRRLLHATMRSAGFVPYDQEFWHFEFGTRRWGALTGTDPIYCRADRPDEQTSGGRLRLVS